MSLLFLLQRRRPTSTLFPYTTLFRSTAAPTSARAPPESGAGRPAEAAPAARPRNTPLLSRGRAAGAARSEEHTSELQSRQYLVCRLLPEKKNTCYTTVNTEDVGILDH